MDFVGDGEMRWNVEEQAWRSGVHYACRFLGYRNGAELINLYKSADIVCVPSRNEPFGIVILEAWSAGKPVVAPKIIEDAKTIVIGSPSHNGFITLEMLVFLAMISCVSITNIYRSLVTT